MYSSIFLIEFIDSYIQENQLVCSVATCLMFKFDVAQTNEGQTKTFKNYLFLNHTLTNSSKYSSNIEHHRILGKSNYQMSLKNQKMNLKMNSTINFKTLIPIINVPANPKILEYLLPIQETHIPHMRPPIGNPNIVTLANWFDSSEFNLRSLNDLKKIYF